MNYAKLASGRDVERTEPTNPRCVISPIGRCSPFSGLLINIPSCSPRENVRETEHGALKAAWYHLLVGVLINPMISAFSGTKGAGRGCLSAETTGQMCSSAPPNPNPIHHHHRRRRCLPVLFRPRPTSNPLLRLDPQSRPLRPPPTWMSRDRPAANRRPLMSGCAPCQRLINRPASLHRRQSVQLRGPHPGQTAGLG